MTKFRCRPAVESDRAFIAWMDELTETFGDEDKPLPADYRETRRRYVDEWDAEQGAVILEATALSDADFADLDSDIRREDPFNPDFKRAENFRASAFVGSPIGSITESKADCEVGTVPAGRLGMAPVGQVRAVPVGAAWLRTFNHENPGYGFVEDGIPEVAIAIRPGAVGRRLSQPLVLGLLDYARELGYPGVSLAVHDDNVRAAKAYTKAGFTLVGRSMFPDHDVMVVRF